MDKNDPSGAALSFTVNVVAPLDRYNASEVVRDKEASKGLVTKMIQKLEPLELRERIRESRECWSAERKADISFFQSKVRAIAVQVSQGELARARINGRRKKRNKSEADYQPSRPGKYNTGPSSTDRKKARTGNAGKSNT